MIVIQSNISKSHTHYHSYPVTYKALGFHTGSSIKKHISNFHMTFSSRMEAKDTVSHRILICNICLSNDVIMITMTFYVDEIRFLSKDSHYYSIRHACLLFNLTWLNLTWLALLLSFFNNHVFCCFILCCVVLWYLILSCLF